jgi:hypothetical protein
LWAGDWRGAGFSSHSEADLSLCSMLAFWFQKDREEINRQFRRSRLMRDKWERDDYRSETLDKAIEGCTEVYGSRSADKKKIADDIVADAAAQAEFWHTPMRKAYTTLPTGESLSMQSKFFHYWLTALTFNTRGKAPSNSQLDEAVNTLTAQAVFNGAEHDVHKRVAEHDGKIYVDLCTQEFDYVQIDKHGWRIVHEVPCKFERRENMGALPIPRHGGSLRALKQFLNVATHDDYRAAVAWLIGAYHPTGPYPVLAIHGQAGAAKSTASRVLRELTDPCTPAMRRPPREERELWIAALNNRVVVFNNISWLPDWLSDGLCALSYDGGFVQRTLFTTEDESVYPGRNPCILNGIENCVTRGDLADRLLQITLPRIEKKKRKSEKQFNAEFDKAKPMILGAVFTAIATGLKHRDNVCIQTERMADFFVWLAACEPALTLHPGSFIRACEHNISDSSRQTLDSCIIYEPLRKVLQIHSRRKHGSTNQWRTNATALLNLLERNTTRSQEKDKLWPKLPHRLSNQLQRMATDLAKIGIDVTIGRTGEQRHIDFQWRTEGIDPLDECDELEPGYMG